MNQDQKKSVSESEAKAKDLVLLKKMTDEEKIDAAAMRILELYRPAFEELAK